MAKRIRVFFLPDQGASDGVLAVEEDGQDHLFVFFSQEQALKICNQYSDCFESERHRNYQLAIQKSLLPHSSPKGVTHVDTLASRWIGELLEKMDDASGTVLTNCPKKFWFLFTPNKKLKSAEGSVDGILFVQDGGAHVYIFYSQEQAVEAVMTHHQITDPKKLHFYLNSISLSALPPQSQREMVIIEGVPAEAVLTAFELTGSALV